MYNKHYISIFFCDNYFHLYVIIFPKVILGLTTNHWKEKNMAGS